MEKNITDITVEELLDSRGTKTIAVTVHAGANSGTFALPSGASTGTQEVSTKESSEAVRIIREVIQPSLLGHEVTNQKGIDETLHNIDQTPLFKNIGGNVTLGVSVGSCKAAAKILGLETWEYVQTLTTFERQTEVPHLFVNLINGGKHAKKGSPIQEHQIIIHTDDVEAAYKAACTIQQTLREILLQKYREENVGFGDEGGFTIPSTSVFDPFLHLQEAIANAQCGVPVSIGADIAASSFYTASAYDFEGERKDSKQLRTFYNELHKRIPELAMVEDPFEESDLLSFTEYKREHPEVLVIGDDLTTTNYNALQKAIGAQAIGGIIIKPNQIGTLSDTFATMELAYAHNIKCIVSHRSGETMDDFIADLAYGTGSYGLKAGAPNAKEREAKYQRLITISHRRHD